MRTPVRLKVSQIVVLALTLTLNNVKRNGLPFCLYYDKYDKRFDQGR